MGLWRVRSRTPRQADAYQFVGIPMQPPNHNAVQARLLDFERDQIADACLIKPASVSTTSTSPGRACPKGEVQLDRGEGKEYIARRRDELAETARQNQRSGKPIDPDALS
jgi:hypothetical protein